ncbi:MAG: hypothetical protein HY795_01840 [Desulfovibrio sp.]|nr:hypothetical protein [Desulfovibrio sp.]MBI4961076.1 hypothetical protein [Desulfovibrio sp.]
MLGLFTLPVLDGETGEIIGMTPPNMGMITNFGAILRYEGCGFTFLDDNGIVSVHDAARPWVEEEEAKRWGFAPATRLTTAIAV